MISIVFYDNRNYDMFFEKVKTESGKVDRFREISKEEYNRLKE